MRKGGLQAKWCGLKARVSRQDDTGKGYTNCRINGHDGTVPGIS